MTNQGREQMPREGREAARFTPEPSSRLVSGMSIHDIPHVQHSVACDKYGDDSNCHACNVDCTCAVCVGCQCPTCDPACIADDCTEPMVSGDWFCTRHMGWVT